MPNIENQCQQLAQWYQSILGKELAAQEHAAMSKLLAELPGNQLLQLSELPVDWLRASRVMYKCILTQPDSSITQPSAYAAFNELPFTNEMFDVVILPHVLECADNYPSILREAARVTHGEGCLIILGFNACSLRALSTVKPPVGNIPSLNNLRYWLKQANCKVERIQTFFYRPLTQQPLILSKLNFMEKICRFMWPSWGASYIIVARKKVPAMTPLNQKIKNWWRYVTAKPLVEPSTRSQRKIL